MFLFSSLIVSSSLKSCNLILFMAIFGSNFLGGLVLLFLVSSCLRFKDFGPDSNFEVTEFDFLTGLEIGVSLSERSSSGVFSSEPKSMSSMSESSSSSVSTFSSSRSSSESMLESDPSVSDSGEELSETLSPFSFTSGFLLLVFTTAEVLILLGFFLFSLIVSFLLDLSLESVFVPSEADSGLVVVSPFSLRRFIRFLLVLDLPRLVTRVWRNPASSFQSACSFRNFVTLSFISLLSHSLAWARSLRLISA
ncbi:unnamed protein product [Owenia fusiformis]|uniref:Uncharacterized protein n=1 Tax=Owenia fusiformis TaxID=6347 RepID=A0A8J1TXF7_OWEFU|nr:unnamed protein product [Owenia fusiformis]